MTNRERILADLADLPPEAFFKALWEGETGNIIDFKVCDDCKADHGGHCPTDTVEGPCPPLEKWLGMPCRHAHLIEPGALGARA